MSNETASVDRPFLRMSGLGNDFVVFDARQQPLSLSTDQVRRIAGRATGPGCDQLIVLEADSSSEGGADTFMRIYNNDGGEVDACGNATRCIGAMLTRELGRDVIHIRTNAGLLIAQHNDDGTVSVDMGAPKFAWQDIPLVRQMDPAAVTLDGFDLPPGFCVNVGNPHIVFLLPDVDAVPIEDVGPRVELHPLFPERVNAGFLQYLGGNKFRLRVWERGAGLTKACGTGACAAYLAARYHRLAHGPAEIVLDGGVLMLDLNTDGHVVMTGDVTIGPQGTVTL